MIEYIMQLPVEWFVLIGTFWEELISPIPAAIILVPAGAQLHAQNGAGWYVLVLALLSALGRVPAAYILHRLGRRLSLHAFSSNRRWFGLHATDMERFRRKLSGRRSWWVLFVMWATPIFPGATLSLCCGFIKFPQRAFLTATFFGSIINAIILLAIGYIGSRTLTILPTFEIASQIVGVLILLIGLIWLIKKRHHHHHTA